EVYRRLGLPGRWTNSAIRTRIVTLQLDTSHFVRQKDGRVGLQRGGRTPIPLESVLRADSRYPTNRLKARLLEERLLPRECAKCGLTEWRGQPIPLELDHINGDRNDNRYANLRLLCPNCHAQTPTYRGRNIGAYSRQSAEPEQGVFSLEFAS